MLGDIGGFIDVVSGEEIEAADHFFGEDIGAVGDGNSAVGFADDFAGILEALGGDELPFLAERFGEFFVFGDGSFAVFGSEGVEGGFGFFGVVEEEDVLVHLRV